MRYGWYVDTSVGKLYIEGYQTRYLFPVLPLLLMIMNNNNQKNNNKNNIY